MEDFSGLGRKRLERMAAAGREVREAVRVLANTNDHVVGEVLRDQDPFEVWDHYPKGDVYDWNTHSQYYFHAHPPSENRFPEHGHFHTFLRPKGMPVGVKPAPVDGFAMPEDPDDALSHLVAISVDEEGRPLRLFTTNRWVTGEVWYRARDVVRMLDLFNIDHARPSWPANRWVTAMVALFRPQIEKLLKERDTRIELHARFRPDGDVYEDKELEVTSVADISVDGQIAAVEAALAAA